MPDENDRFPPASDAPLSPEVSAKMAATVAKQQPRPKLPAPDMASTTSPPKPADKPVEETKVKSAPEPATNTIKISVGKAPVPPAVPLSPLVSPRTEAEMEAGRASLAKHRR